jgi:hypothetical protein
VLGLPEQLAFAREQIGTPHDERDLGELRRLQAEPRAELDPVAVVVDLHPHARQQDQAEQTDRAEQDRVGEHPVDPR